MERMEQDKNKADTQYKHVCFIVRQDISKQESKLSFGKDWI